MPGSDAFVGEITMFAGNFAPRGWAFCEGQTLPISQNQALFAILGTTYGGDGRTNFKLPDLKKQWSRLGGVKYIIAIQGIFPSRS
jgi:microcystin-dependent protein